MNSFWSSSGRTPLHHPSWAEKRKSVLMALFMSALMLQLLFLGSLSYLMGAAYGQSSHVKGLNILAVDFDGGAIGQALQSSYLALSGASFPTLQFVSAEEYPTPASLRQAVCKGDYWGAVYTHAGASDRLWEAVEGTSSSTYDSSDVVTYTFNEARYAAVAAGSIQANLETLIAATRGFYYQTTNGTAAFAAIKNETTVNKAALRAFLNPITATSDLIMPTTQGVRVFLNTVMMLMPVLAQFFYQMAMNGISLEHGVLARGRISHVWAMRFVIGKVYTFFASLVMTGLIWAFREDWVVSGSQFGLTWMVFWLNMECNWLIIDAVLNTLIPIPFVPHFVLTWVMINISSSVFPFELQAGFYRIGWALPARETWSMLVLIWSGCADEKYTALPILFSWWVVGSIASFWSVRKRCLDAEAQAAAATAGQRATESEKETTTRELGANKGDDLELGGVSARSEERHLRSADSDRETLAGDRFQNSATQVAGHDPKTTQPGRAV